MTAKPVSKKKGVGSDADFTFEASAGPITVPSCSVAPAPPPLLINEIMDEYDEGRAQAKITLLLLKTAVGDENYAVIRQMDASELKRFNEKWREHSGCGLGEFRAS